MQRNKRFNKKKAVRFQLVPGVDQKGNPTTTFKPVQTRNKLSKKQRNKIISQISDYQIQIDGKPVHQSQIPSFVLEQIKGRSDLVFVQKNPDIVNDSGKDQQMNQQYMMEQMDEEWDEQGQEIPQQEYMNAMQLPPAQSSKGLESKKVQQEEVKEIQVDGHKYTLTASQMRKLQQILPENYQDYKIEGVQFIKYDQYGNRIDQRDKYKKYLADSQQKRAIVDYFEYVPSKPANIVDNDLQQNQIKGDLKEVEDALNYEGDDDAYEQLQDDFFTKLIKGGKEDKPSQKQDINKGQAFKKKKENLIQENTRTIQVNKKIQPKLKKNQKQKQNKVSKLDDLEYAEYQLQDEQQYQDMDDEQYQDQDDYQDQEYEQQITDQMLDKAIEQFDKKVQRSNKEKNQCQIGQTIQGTGIPKNMKGMNLVKFIQSRQQCIGKDGELDWRTLTKKQKRQYMKNKKIRSVFDEVREREINQKLLNKNNVSQQQLHLKKYIEHIPYKQDHVMQEAIKRDQEQVINIDAPPNEQDFETESDQDDIISYRAKTSIISSNLAIVQQQSSSKKKIKKTGLQQEQNKQKVNIEKIKIVPEKRDRKQTSQQRKKRKQRLKQLKKKRKQQKQEFNQLFEGEKKKVMKKEKGINNNPLHKVPYVKIV